MHDTDPADTDAVSRSQGAAGAPAGQHTISAERLVEAVEGAFVAAGLSPRAARTVARSLVESDMRGVPSHGVMLVPMYLERIRKGSVSIEERGRIAIDAGAVAVIDAGHCLGQLVADQAMTLAIDKARTHGLGAVAVRHAFHFGAAYRYALAAADEGLIGLALANTRPLMPAPGGAIPVVGNNPIAVAIPYAEQPVILDMALSEVALGKIRQAAAEGREIPSMWATDSTGQPTTDAAAAIAGMLLPAGGTKGFGLAIVVDVLCGALSGGSSGSDVKGLYTDTAVPNDCAQFFLAIDPLAFDPDGGFPERVAKLCREIVGSPRAPGVERIYLPGGPEYEQRQRAASGGIAVNPDVLAALASSRHHDAAHHE